MKNGPSKILLNLVLLVLLSLGLANCDSNHLPTTPLMAEASLEGFSAFMAHHADYLLILQKMEHWRLEIFKP